MSKEIMLPIIIGGTKIYGNEQRELLTIKYDSGVDVVIPAVNADEIERMKSSNKFILHDLKLQEIISFIVKVGRFWREKSNSNPLYEEAIENLCLVNGYNRKMAVREMNLIGSAWSNIAGLYDMVDYELGNRLYLDEWIPRGDALVHTQPVGNLVNVMVGNVPVSGVMSILRGLLTKNQTIAKLPKRDPITTMYLVMSMIEIDPEHPVTKSMNIMYWVGGDKMENEILDLANAICVWGGQNAVDNIKAKAKAQIECVVFGPKTSFAVIGKEMTANKKVALDLVHDVCIYNQEACFCPQVAFVEGDYTEMVSNLKKAFKLYNKMMPKGNVVCDTKANVTRTRLEALYMGNDVYYDDEKEWTIIVINNMSEINEHPLNRVIFIKPVKDISEVSDYIDESIQTISIAPWSRNDELRECVTLKGAAKFTEIGMVASMRNGATHDNIYPMQHFVRWVCVERGSDYWGKFIENGPIDTTKWIMQSRDELEDVEKYLIIEGEE